MSFKEFKRILNGRHDGHLGYRNGTILTILNLCPTVKPPIKFQFNPTYGLDNGTGRLLAILNLHVATMPPTKFQLNSTYGSGGDVENVKS